MNEDQTKTTDFVAAWIASHRHEIGGTDLRFIRQEEHGRTLCVEFETVQHLLQVCAWDHGYCLDILALNKKTGADAFVVAGECDGVSGLTERLEGFLQWLKVNEPNRNASSETN